MAGCSITLLKLDDELTRLWDAPVRHAGAARRLRVSITDLRGPRLDPGLRGRRSPSTAPSWSELDTAIGDGDHGTNMDRGMRKAVEKLEAVEGDDIGALLKAVGMTLVSSVGGAAGPLYGTLFLQMGAARPAGVSSTWPAGPRRWRRASSGVQSRGKAEPGDKTMIDALLPARGGAARGEREGAGIADALRRSAAAAEEGMRATIPLEARKGRASYLGPRSVGHQDPGATSLAAAAGDAVATFGDGG